MSDYDRDIALALERGGVRLQSGHHPRPLDAEPKPRNATCNVVKNRTQCTLPYGHDGWHVFAPWDDLPDPADRDPWVDRRDHYER